MNDRFESLESGEVVSVQHDNQVLSGHRTFRVGELSEAIESHLAQAIADWNEEKKAWFSDRGIDCEALRFGSNGWQKGRIRLCLEFCPDEPNPQAQSVSHNSIPNTTHTSNEIADAANTSLQLPSSSNTTPNLHYEHTEPSTAHATEPSPAEEPQDRQHTSTVATVEHEPAIVTSDEDRLKDIAIPVAGIAAMGTVAAAAAMATPDLHDNANLEQPPLMDAILELEEHHSDRTTPHQSFDEIAFDFDAIDGDRAVASPNSVMELDLTDLGLDFPEQDLLSFETNGMSDASEEFASLQDLSQPENSGMLIDEVWNEMNQGNWPGIN